MILLVSIAHFGSNHDKRTIMSQNVWVLMTIGDDDFLPIYVAGTAEDVMTYAEKHYVVCAIKDLRDDPDGYGADEALDGNELLQNWLSGRLRMQWERIQTESYCHPDRYPYTEAIDEMYAWKDYVVSGYLPGNERRLSELSENLQMTPRQM